MLLLMMITLLNDGALITIGYDHVEGSPRPTVPNPLKIQLMETSTHLCLTFGSKCVHQSLTGAGLEH